MKAQKIIIVLIVLAVAGLVYDRLVQRIKIPIKLVSVDEEAAEETRTLLPEAPRPATPADEQKADTAADNLLQEVSKTGNLSPKETYLQYLEVSEKAKTLGEIRKYLTAESFSELEKAGGEKTIKSLNAIKQVFSSMQLEVVDEYVAVDSAVVKFSNEGKEGVAKTLIPESENYVYMKKIENRWVVVKESPQMVSDGTKLSAQQFLESVTSRTLSSEPKSKTAVEEKKPSPSIKQPSEPKKQPIETKKQPMASKSKSAKIEKAPAVASEPPAVAKKPLNESKPVEAKKPITEAKEPPAAPQNTAIEVIPKKVTQ